VRHAARWKYRTQKSRKIRHLRQFCRAVSSQLIHVSIIGKEVVKQQYLHTLPQYGELGPLTAEIGSGVCGTPANFNRFRVLPSLLQRRRSTETNQTLQDVWPSPGLLHYIYIFGGSCPLTEFCPVQKSLCVQVLRSHMAELLHGRHSSSGRQPNFAAWYNQWHYRTFAEGATYIRQGGHHVEHRPTF